MSSSPSLLSCSVCGNDLFVSGRNGALIETRCSCCDLSSSDLISDVLLANKSQKNKEHVIEIYHLRK